MKTRRSEESGNPWEALPKHVIEGVYRHYWLDFILFGYDIPKELSTKR